MKKFLIVWLLAFVFANDMPAFAQNKVAPSPLRAQQAVQPSAWAYSWEAFAKFCEPFLSSDEKREELRNIVENKEVEWQGTVREIGLSGAGPFYEISMKPISITVLQKRVVLDVITLIPKNSNVALWEKVKVGNNVRFKTTVRGEFPKMLFNIMKFDSVVEPALKRGVSKGDVFVWIATEDAALITQ